MWKRAEFERMEEMHRLWWIVFAGMLSMTLAQDAQKYPVDPKTGRAAGAREISPEELKKYIDAGKKSLIIDVRDPDAFAKQTIKGAINIPLDKLRAYLKNIPKDTALFFT
jgi:3-mercaptopyruvate sulfurtransferase SseA